jgi:hypothetical protein
MAQLVVQLTSDMAAAFAKGEARAAALRRTLRDLGVTLRPLDPDAEDPVLATYFNATVPSAQQAAQVVERLVAQPGVSSAYVKPTIGLP